MPVAVCSSGKVTQHAELAIRIDGDLRYHAGLHRAHRRQLAGRAGGGDQRRRFGKSGWREADLRRRAPMAVRQAVVHAPRHSRCR